MNHLVSRFVPHRSARVDLGRRQVGRFDLGLGLSFLSQALSVRVREGPVVRARVVHHLHESE